MTDDLTELLAAYRAGEITLDQLSEAFRRRSWPVRRKPRPRTYLELAAAAQEDPEPDLPGSFDEVTASYDRGELTDVEYRILSEAAAYSINSEATRGRASGEAETE
jgi:hypothetical protein